MEGDIYVQRYPSKLYHVFFLVFDSLLCNLKSSKQEKKKKEKKFQEHATHIIFFPVNLGVEHFKNINYQKSID